MQEFHQDLIGHGTQDDFLTIYLTKYTLALEQPRKGPSMKSDAEKMLAEKCILMALMTTKPLQRYTL